MKGSVRLHGVDSSQLFVGAFLVLIGLMMPLAANVRNFMIYDSLSRALGEREKIYVLLAAIKLVALNSLRSFPHYLGAFFLGEALDVRYKGRRLQAVRTVSVCVLIPLVYLLIELIYDIHYDFSGPAVLVIAMLVMVEKANFNMVDLSKKALMLVLLITAMQFLDVMPALDTMPFGRGETSHDIKMAAKLLGAEPFLQEFAVLLFTLMLLSAILLCKLIMDENNLRILSELKGQNERMRAQQQMQALEERTQQELRHLVHDLKTPLTAAQALVSVVKMGCQQREGGGRDEEYLTKVEASMEQMSAMVSEILYADHRVATDTDRIVTAFLAQTSNAAYAPLVKAENLAPGVRVQVNEIRFLRALVNLVENAYHALPEKEGEIWLRVRRPRVPQEPPAVEFCVEDNGQGIPVSQMERIWEEGYSTRGSHGLGLRFVRQVVDTNQGDIHVESRQGEGTRMTVCLPELFDE